MIVTQMESLADQILARCPSVSTITLSSIISRKTFQRELIWKNNETNWLLNKLISRRGWKYIDNDIIDPDNHLATDGIHLNAEGVRLLAVAISAHVHNAGHPSLQSTNRSMPGNGLSSTANITGSTNSQPRYLYSDVLAGSKPAGRNVPSYRPQPTTLAYDAPRSSLQASNRPVPARKVPLTTTGNESTYSQPGYVVLDGAKPSDVNITTAQPQPNIPPVVVNSNPAYTINRYTGCYNCGETNHKKYNCKYDMKLKCNSCFRYGHKARFCGTGKITKKTAKKTLP